MNFDPSKYKISTSAEWEVEDAEGNTIYLDDEQTTPWTITVASPGTKKASKADHEYQQAISGDFLARLKGKKSTKKDDADEIARAEFLVKITEGTNAPNLVYNEKTGLDALAAIYRDPLMGHVATGLFTFHKDRGNFSGTSPKNSNNTSDTQPG